MPPEASSSDHSRFHNDIDRLTTAVGWSMVPPPEVVRQQVLNLFDEHHGLAPVRQHTTAHRVQERELLVVRADDQASHLVYASPLADVAISVDNGIISGQVIPIVRPTPAAFSVTVIDGPTDARSFEGDRDGGFSLPPVADGHYRLLLDNTHLEIELDVQVTGGRS